MENKTVLVIVSCFLIVAMVIGMISWNENKPEEIVVIEPGELNFLNSFVNHWERITFEPPRDSTGNVIVPYAPKKQGLTMTERLGLGLVE